jgi:tetratricopeptide (TPR) repeat protein
MPRDQQALTIRQHVLGPEHPNVAQSLNNLAALYPAQGKYEQAEPLLKRALAIYKKTFGPHYPDTKSIQENYARFLEEKQRKRRLQDEQSEGSQQRELALATLARHLMLLPVYGAIHNSNALLGMNQNAPGGQTRSGRPTSSQHA